MFVPPPIRKRLAGPRLTLLGRDQRRARRHLSDRTRPRFRVERLEDRCLLSITEVPLPAPNNGLSSIAAGPDGNLWFTEPIENNGPGIGDINPTTHAINQFDLPTAYSLPCCVTAGPDGNVWFSEGNASQIGEIDPTTDAITEYPVPYEHSSPGGMTVGPDGNIWFTDANGSIGTFNLTSRAISELPLPAGYGAGSITVGPDGNLWFAEMDEGGTSAIGMINPTTHAISEYPVPSAGSWPVGIAAGPDGNLWFTEQRSVFGNKIGEINPTTHVITEYPVPTAGAAPTGITAGPDGNLWFTEVDASQIGEINPTTDVITEYALPDSYGTPLGITAGPDGNLWFTDGNGGGPAIAVDTLNSADFVVTQQPPISITVGTPFGLTVQAEDSSGKLDSAFNGTVTVALANNPGGATLGGTLSVTASSGTATFSGLTLNTAAAGYTLQVSSSGVTAATTTAITVTPAAASQLVIMQQPSAAATAGQAFGAQPVIDEEDQFGNLETGDNSTAVTASLESGTGPLQGTTTVTVSGGVATFTSLAENKAETISLQFSSGSLVNATSTNIVVSPGAASQLVIHTQPLATATAGQAFGTQPVIYEEDQYGNLETGDNSKLVTATLASGTGPLHGTTTVTVSGGVATFTNLVDRRAETISLGFSGGSLTNAASANIVVNPAAASKLVIQTQPSPAASAGQAFTTQPVIMEEDQYGNLETGDNSTVLTATLESGTGPLQGTTTVTVSGGMATFAGLADDTAESITLLFSGGGLNSFPTSSIVVSPATTSRLVITQEPPATAMAGLAFATQPVITEEDQFGNVETGDNNTTITASLASGAGPLLGTTTIAVKGGVATFTNLAGDTAETVTLTFTGLGLTAGPSSSVAVSPAKASQLVIHTQPPATATAGQPFASGPLVYEEDPFGNLETGDNSTVITATLTSGSGLLQGTIVMVSGGVAAFTNLDDQTAETVTLTFTGGGLTSVPSSSITVSPAAASKVVFGQQPASAAPGAAITPAVTVKVEDAFNNVVSSDGSTVTLTLSGGTFEGGSSTAATATSSGVATFGNLKIDVPGSYTLSAADGALTPTGASNSFTIRPATASQLVIHTQPSSTATAGRAFGTQAVVYEEDQFGNLETGDNSTVVTATLESSAGPLQGTTTVTVSGGVATFTNLADNKAETIALNFTSGSLTNATSINIVVSPATASQLVIHAQPSATAAAGQAFATQPVIYEVDRFGNLETGDNSTVVTASLQSGAGPIQGMTTVTVSGGVATFTTLADDTAETISLTFTGGGLTAGPSSSITVSPATASQFVVHTQPSSTSAAGQAFATQPVIDEEDQFGNLETGDNSTVVTASLGSGTGPLQGTTTVTVSGGVARFTNLADNRAETFSLNFRSGSLSSAPTPPIAVTAPAPTIRLEEVLTARKTNKKGKPVGKPVLVGFALDYSTAMDPSTAGLGANYQVDRAVTKRVKKKRMTVLRPVNFSAAYNQSTNSVTLTIKGKQPFAKGGQIKVIASPPNGVSSQAGVLLDTSDTVFTILAKAKAITPG
ncbi:MAG: hypothetical protein ACHRXM_15455 [Isosphaerales bacterium]